MAVLKILILFLIIQTCYKFVICGDLDHDYYYSMEEVSEGPDVTTKMPADNEMTHVRSKNLSGNIKLTTLEILPTITPFDGLNNESGNAENGISDGATNEFVSINKNKQDGIQTIGENQQLTSLSEVTTKVPTDGTLGPYTVMNVFSNTSGITATEKQITVTTLQPKIIDQDMTSTPSYFDLFNFGDDEFDKIEANETISSDDEKIEEVSSTPTIFNLLSPQYSEEIEETSSYTSVTEATGPINQNSEDVEDISSFLEVDEDFLKSVPNDTILDQSIEDMSNILDFEIIENELDVINIKENNQTEHEISDKNEDTGITTEEDFISEDTNFFTDKESEDTSSIETFYEDTLNFEDKNNVTTTEKTEDGENDHSLNEASVEVENEETTEINVKSNKKGLEYQNESTEDISSIVTENYASTKTEKTEEIFVRNEDTTVVTETKNFTDDVTHNPVNWNEFNDLQKETEDLDLEDKNEATEEISSIVTENYANTKTERIEEISVRNEDTTIATTLATETKNFFDDVTDNPVNWNEFNDLQKETEDLDLEDKNEAIEDISSIVTENYGNNKIETTEEISVRNEDTTIATTLATETKNFTDDVTENPVNWNEFNDLQKETEDLDLEDKNEATEEISSIVTENYANTKTERTEENPVKSEDTTIATTLATETKNFTDDVTENTVNWNEFNDLQKETKDLKDKNEATEEISSIVTENYANTKTERTEENPVKSEDTTIATTLATETKNFTDDVTENPVNWNEFNDLQKETEDLDLEDKNEATEEISSIVTENYANTKTERIEEISVRNEDTTIATTLATETKNFFDDVTDNPVNWNEFNDLQKETEDLDLEDKNEAIEDISSIVTENYGNNKIETTEEISVRNEDTTIATTLATETKNFTDDVTENPVNWNEFNDLQKETEDLDLEDKNEATEEISSIVTENYANTKTERTEENPVKSEDTTIATTLATETKNFTDDVTENPVNWNEFNDLQKETEDLDLEDKNEATEEISSIVTENYANTKTERTEENPVKSEDTTIATTLATETKNFTDDVTENPVNWNEFNDLQKETEDLDLEDKNEATEEISSIVTENYANTKTERTEENPVKSEDTTIATTLATETKNFTDDVTENTVNWNEFNDLQKETKDLKDKNEATEEISSIVTENYANTKTEETKEIPVRSEDTTMGVTLATETKNFTDDVTHKTHSWNEFSDLQKATNNLEEQNEAIEDISSTVTENYHVSAKIEKTEEIPNRNEDTTITAILATETKNFTDDVTNNAVNWNEFSDLQKATEDFSSNFILKENSTIIIVNEASTVASNTSTKNEENTNLTEIFREIEDERKKSSEESIKFINEDEMTTTDMKILTENFLYSTEENKQTTITDNEITEETFQNNRDKSQDDEEDKYEDTTDKNLNENEENPTTINKEEEIVKNDLLMEKYDTFAVTTAQITEWSTENFSDKDNVELASSTKTNLLSKSIKKTEEIDREQNFNKVTSPPNHHKTNLVTKTQDIKLDNFVTPFHPNENKFNLTTAEMLTTEEIKTMETKEPQISGNISGKQIHFSVKIIDQDANFFIPSDASITFPTPDSINITWKSTSEKFNNSLGFYQNSIQLNIVKSNRMHIHKTRFISNTQNKSEDIDTQLITLDNGIQIRFSSLDFLKAKFGTTNQNKALAAEIMGGCVGVSVITGVVVYYVMKKYKGKTRNFKPNSEA